MTFRSPIFPTANQIRFRCTASLALLGLSLFNAPVSYAAITISSEASKNLNCSGGVCSPTAKNAVLNVGDLTSMLASGNVTVNTGTGALAAQVKDIIVASTFNWASASSLTLDAFRSVVVSEPVEVNGSAPVVLLTNDGGSEGVLSFGVNGRLSFLGTANSVAIDGSLFTLENSVAALAAAIAANPSGNYALASNYNASGDGTYSESPIGNTLTGSVQGFGNGISNLSIKQGGGGVGIALFASVGTTGKIDNIRLSKIAYKNSNHKSGAGVGGLVLNNAGYLFGDQVTGSISATGYHEGPRGSAGGLVDNNNQTGTIVSSSAAVRITARNNGGGLVADNDGVISLSHADGDVAGESPGGLVGINYGSVSQSYATGTAVGGLIGRQWSGSVTDSYATGAVGGGSGGGLIGTSNSAGSSTISTSYATGAVQSGNGGFACTLYASVATNDYWDTTTSGTTDGVCDGNQAGITGLTTAQLQSGLPTGFKNTIWAESSKINGGLPYLINNAPVAK
jgi:hypothetical protein